MVKKPIFIILIFLLLISIGIYAPIAHMLDKNGTVSGLNAGIVVPEPVENQGPLRGVVNPVNSWSHGLETIYQNFLPFQIRTVATVQNAIRALNRPFYRLYSGTVSHSCEFMGERGTNRYYKIELEMSDGTSLSFIEAVNSLTEEERSERIKSQAEAVNRLIRATDEDINIVVYATCGMEFASFLQDYIPDEKSCAKDLELFFSKIDPRAKTGSIQFESVFDRAERVFLTDHHWTGIGSYKGYEDIISLFRSMTEEILPARPFGKTVAVKDCMFYGSYARTLALEDMWDNFSVVDYHLPRYEAEYSFDVSKYPDWSLDLSERIRWLEERHVSTMNASVYGEFYQELSPITFPDNHTGHKLLVIGDSYMQGVAELLASNFDESYFFYWKSYKSLDYNEFIREHGITDVLITLYGQRLVYNSTNDYYLNKIHIDSDDEEVSK